MADDHGYVGECPKCGGAIVVTAIIEDRTFVAKHVAEMVEGGYTVLHRTIEEIRTWRFGHDDDCTFEADKEPQLNLPTGSR